MGVSKGGSAQIEVIYNEGERKDFEGPSVGGGGGVGFVVGAGYEYQRHPDAIAGNMENDSPGTQRVAVGVGFEFDVHLSGGGTSTVELKVKKGDERKRESTPFDPESKGEERTSLRREEPRSPGREAESPKQQQDEAAREITQAAGSSSQGTSSSAKSSRVNHGERSTQPSEAPAIQMQNSDTIIREGGGVCGQNMTCPD